VPAGPGKYDAECTAAREAAHAEGCILIVYGGNRGSGFSIQAPLPLLSTLPHMLRDMANEIESSYDEAVAQAKKEAS